MIKNQRQYGVTKAQVARLDSALAKILSRPRRDEQVHPLLHKAEIEALQSQIEELKSEVAEYDALLSGQRKVLEVNSFEALPRALIQARIAAGLSQKELADRLGLKEQQIQRYEATEYTSASMKRISEVIDALGLRIRKEVFLPSGQGSFVGVVRRLREVGIEPDLVLKRLLPAWASVSLKPEGARKPRDVGGMTLHLALLVRRVFGINPAQLLGDAPLQLSVAPFAGVRFKTTERVAERRFSAYTVYAHYLALLLLQAMPQHPTRPIPSDAAKFREAVLNAYGAMDLKSTLLFLWETGTPVLPLNDPGAFHSACWRVTGRNVIVLKQQTASQSRWLYDLLHETFHAAQAPDDKEHLHIETGEDWREARVGLEEQQAGEFAGNVILAGRAEELVNLCVKRASGRVEFLKRAVPDVASAEHISVGALANYMAFRLSLQNINWWGTANNLQEQTESPFGTARDILLAKADVGRLNDVDRELLIRALADVEEVEHVQRE
jgi:transcriptional regulator with XRE-family HTH domain